MLHISLGLITATLYVKYVVMREHKKFTAKCMGDYSRGLDW